MRFIVDVDNCSDPSRTRARLVDAAHRMPWESATVTLAQKDGRVGESQPMPTITDAGDIQSMVIADIVARREVGIQRYGTALQAHNGRNALADAYDEAVDLACYLKQALVEAGS